MQVDDEEHAEHAAMPQVMDRDAEDSKFEPGDKACPAAPDTDALQEAAEEEQNGGVPPRPAAMEP